MEVEGLAFTDAALLVSFNLWSPPHSSPAPADFESIVNLNGEP